MILHTSIPFLHQEEKPKRNNCKHISSLVRIIKLERILPRYRLNQTMPHGVLKQFLIFSISGNLKY